MFQLKDFTSITASMLNHLRAVTSKITDMRVGAIGRTMLESVAIEIEELYQQMFYGVRDAIPVALYNSLDFASLPAVSARGSITVTVQSSPSSLAIPSGTVFVESRIGTRYVTVSNQTISAGATLGSLAVVAVTPGAAGNLPAGGSFALVNNAGWFVSATNPAPLIGGTEPETPEQKKVRFASFISSLARGTTAAIEYGLRTATVKNADGQTIEVVRSAAVIEPYKTDPGQPMGLVTCYVHNGVDGASAALLANASSIILGYTDSAGVRVPGWKAAGVKVTLTAAGQVAVAVAGAVTAQPGYATADLVAPVTAAIADYLGGVEIGGTALRAEIVAMVMNMEGVYNFTLTTPANDVTSTKIQKIMPAAITIAAV